MKDRGVVRSECSNCTDAVKTGVPCNAKKCEYHAGLWCRKGAIDDVVRMRKRKKYHVIQMEVKIMKDRVEARSD